MVPVAGLVAFILVALPIILLPGPSVLFVIGRSLSLGRVGGLLSVAGNSLGALVGALVVALGVGTIIAQSAIVFSVVKVLGAAYLIYLGVQAIRHRRDRADAATRAVPPRRKLVILGQGFVVGVTNPKTIVFFIAVLPQFVDYSAGGIPLQLLALGTLFVVVATLSDAAWAFSAGTAREWFAKFPRRISTLGASGGVVMIALGTVSLFVGHGTE
jgi:threonine/homoserine/homoserine lactone efflux protein